MTQVTTTNKRDLQGILSSPAVQNRLKDILGRRASTFATSVIQIAQSNEMLAGAEPNSIVGAAMTAATLNLPLNNSLGYAYIIPFKDNKTGLTKAQFQIGYKGFIQLAQRSGQFKRIHATDVRQGEIKTRDRLSGAMEFDWIDDDTKRENTPVEGYVAYFSLINGFEAILFMSIAELNLHGKKFSQTFKKGFGLWKDDFDSMSKKTVLKLLLSKYAPLSIDMQTAVQVDQASFNDAENTEDISYVDNEDVKIDPDEERLMILIKGAESQDELELAKGSIPEGEGEKWLPLIKAKQKELNLKNKE